MTSCGEGSFPNAADDACIACSESAPYRNSDGNACLDACPASEYVNLAGNACVTSCGEGEYINLTGDACVASCDEGEYINLAGDACVTSCDEGEYINLAGDACVTSCDEGEYINLAGDACVSSCGAGEAANMSDNSCQRAIYLWLSGCEVQGNMQGDGSGTTCSSSTSGIAGADALCAALQSSAASAINATPQATSGTSQAVLATSSQNPKDIISSGSDVRPVLRPDGTRIADSWDDFFTVDMAALHSVKAGDGLGVSYFTGLYASEGEFVYHNNGACVNSGSAWTSNSNTAGGLHGRSTYANNIRLDASGATRQCDFYSQLLCVTH